MYMCAHTCNCTTCFIPTLGLFDRALEGNLSEGKDYLDLWTTYSDYMRRKIDFDVDTRDEVEKKMVELRTIFTRARTHLNKCELHV